MDGLLGAKRRDQRRVALPLRRIMQAARTLGVTNIVGSGVIAKCNTRISWASIKKFVKH